MFFHERLGRGGHVTSQNPMNTIHADLDQPNFELDLELMPKSYCTPYVLTIALKLRPKI